MATSSQDNPFPTASDMQPGGTSTPSSATSPGASGSGYGSASSGYGGSGTGGASASSAGSGNGARGVDTDAVLSRVVQGAHDVVDRVAEKAGPALERLKSKVSGAQESMRGNADQISAMQEEWVATCRSTVREHPLAAVAVALAAGVVLSKLMSSR